MNLSNFIFAGLFSVLLSFKQTRLASAVILLGYLIYYFSIVDLPGEYYYHSSALLNTVIGVILIKKYPAVAILSFSLILINLIGFVLYDNFYDPSVYNKLSSFAIFLQIIMLTIRMLLNGVNFRGAWGRAMVYIVGGDSYKSYSSVQKRQVKGEK